MTVDHLVLDVVTQVGTPVAAADSGLGTYTFLPYHRTGVVAGCTTPFSTAAASRGTVTVQVRLTDGGEPRPTGAALTLRGPGDVLGIDRRQVVRRYPEPGTADAEPSDLAHCELDLPDLPWMFTPTGPDAAGRLPSWLRLVVAPVDEVQQHAPSRPGLPPSADVRLADLPPPDDAWAWAHVQVTGPLDAGLDGRIGPASPQLNLARLLCPRHLTPGTRWIAMVVPTFEAGRRAGLGIEETVAHLAYAWGPTAPDPQTLPVYDSWQFSTGKEGDFETLAKRLTPVTAPPTVGRRLVDTGAPGLGMEPAGPPGPRSVRGPLVSPLMDGAEPAGRWDEATTEALRARVEQPDRFEFDPDADDDAPVAPPLYGGVHLSTGILPEQGAGPAWLRTLNLDPEHRIAAALGAAVARMDQEPLMTSAWAQLPAVRDANAALRAAQLARFVGERLHRRHLDPMTTGQLLVATQRAHARTLVRDGATARAVVAASATPLAATGPVLRRLARPAGPLRRYAAQQPVTAYDELLVDGDRGTDWVRPYTEPDGVHRLSEASVRLLEEADLDLDVVERFEILAEPSVLDELARDGRPHADVQHRDVDADLRRQAMEALLDALPTLEELAGSADGDTHEAMAVAAALQPQAVGLAWTEDEWLLDVDVLDRHRYADGDLDERGRALRTSSSSLVEGLLMPIWDHLREAGLVGDGPFETPSGDVIRRLVALLSREHRELEGQLDALYSDLAVETDDLREPPREPLAVGALGLSGLLAPQVTVPRRIRSRIPSLEEHFPGWLANDRLDQVMAAPTFRHPMFEALNRYDPEWLLPGVGRVQPHELVTVLTTNPAFVEAFLVGLNHEFARELVWRDYPTDGRATSFRSFWTRSQELLEPLHRMRTGDLGDHIDPRYSDKLVFLVRGELVRGHPQLLAHATTQVGAPPVAYRDPIASLFQLPLAPDLLLVGFDLTEEQVLVADGGSGPLHPVPPPDSWWFTLSEHVGEPRFGLDEKPGSSTSRDDLAWSRWSRGAPPSAPFLDADALPQVSNPPPGATGAALVAWLLFQLPARAGFRMARLLHSMKGNAEERDRDG